jgi:hypothetical protein
MVTFAPFTRRLHKFIRPSMLQAGGMCSTLSVVMDGCPSYCRSTRPSTVSLFVLTIWNTSINHPSPDGWDDPINPTEYMERHHKCWCWCKWHHGTDSRRYHRENIAARSCWKENFTCNAWEVAARTTLETWLVPRNGFTNDLPLPARQADDSVECRNLLCRREPAETPNSVCDRT